MLFTFASKRDPMSGLSQLTFDDFVKLASVFSYRAPEEIKQYWAFKMFDFDNDNVIGEWDVHNAVRIVVGPSMHDNEIKEIVDKVFNEVDLDGNKSLTVGEFAAMMRRFTDFMLRFNLHLL